MYYIIKHCTSNSVTRSSTRESEEKKRSRVAAFRSLIPKSTHANFATQPTIVGSDTRSRHGSRRQHANSLMLRLFPPPLRPDPDIHMCPMFIAPANFVAIPDIKASKDPATCQSEPALQRWVWTPFLLTLRHVLSPLSTSFRTHLLFWPVWRLASLRTEGNFSVA